MARRKKKAQIDVLKAIRGILIAAVIVFVFISIFGGFYRLLVPQPGKGIKDQFNIFEANLEDAQATERTFSDVLQLTDNFNLFGFDAITPAVYDSCASSKPPVERPPECGYDACICLCKWDDDCTDFRDCRRIKGAKYILAQEGIRNNYGRPRHVNGINGNMVAFYADCYELGSFGLQTLTVEKIGDVLLISKAK